MHTFTTAFKSVQLRMVRFFTFSFISFLLLFSNTTQAVEASLMEAQTDDQTNASPKFKSQLELDSIRHNLAWIGGHIDNITNSVDTFFAPSQSLIDYQSLVQIKLSHQQSQYLNSTTKPEFRLHIRLPKTEKRWNLFVESTLAADKEATRGSAQSKAAAPQEATLGLNTLYRVSDFIGFQLRTGLALTDNTLDPYLKARLRFERPISSVWFTSFEPEWLWSNIEGPGKQATLNIAYRHSERHHLRSRTNIFKYDQDENADISQRFEWQHDIDANNRVSYQAGRVWTWDDLQEVVVQDTYLQVSWRKQMFENWLFLMVTPGVHRPLELEEKTNPFLYLGIEAFSRKVPL